jgi:hypothetical protein
MATFAVTYTYGAPNEVLDQIRPTHRAYLSSFLEVGVLLASGPYVGVHGALLIFRAESAQAVADLLDQDPFHLAGYIAERTITEWNPIFGPWSAA